MVVSCLVPLARSACSARRPSGAGPGSLAVAIASIYFPFIEYGALFLSEIYFILWLGARVRRLLRRARRAAGGWSRSASRPAGGFALSIAIAMKIGRAARGGRVLRGRRGRAAARAARPALRRRRSSPSPSSSWRARLRPWLLRGAVVAVGAAPLLGVLTRVCTRANRGHFCVAGNKVGADFLLGHYGRIADIDWGADEGHGVRSSAARARTSGTTRSTRRSRSRSRTTRRTPPRPGAGSSTTPSRPSCSRSITSTTRSSAPRCGRPTATRPGRTPQLFQYAFVCPPVHPDRVRLRGGSRKRGARALARPAAPRSSCRRSLALAATVAIATGEVRYRIPFDIFFIVVACAFVVGELRNQDPYAGASTNTPTTGK